MKLHAHENNQLSMQFFNEHKGHFSAQALKVYELLKSGVRLTTINAPGYGILSLPRRIKDLKDHNGIEIGERWVEVGGVKIKEWFINPC